MNCPHDRGIDLFFSELNDDPDSFFDLCDQVIRDLISKLSGDWQG
jgi:hypothetical protein